VHKFVSLRYVQAYGELLQRLPHPPILPLITYLLKQRLNILKLHISLYLRHLPQLLHTNVNLLLQQQFILNRRHERYLFHDFEGAVFKRRFAGHCFELELDGAGQRQGTI